MKMPWTAADRNLPQKPALNRFADILSACLNEGIRPGVPDGERWTFAEFAASIDSRRLDSTSVSERTVSNWCKGKSLPSKIDPILNALFGQASNFTDRRAQLKDAFTAAAAEKNLRVISAEKTDAAGARWKPEGDHFAVDQTPSASDAAAAALPLKMQLQAAALSHTEQLSELARGLGNSPTWSDLPNTSHKLGDLLRKQPDEIAANLGSLYAYVLQLGRFLETAREMQGREDDALPPRIKGALTDLVSIAAPWMRGFPSIVEMDDAAGQALYRPHLVSSASELFRQARLSGAITDADASLLGQLASVASQSGVLGEKAANRAVGTAKNFILAAAEAAAAEQAAIEPRSQFSSELASNAANALAQSKNYVREFARTMSPDVRAALELRDDIPLSRSSEQPSISVQPTSGSLSTLIGPHLPYLRRFARSLGKVTSEGDGDVARLLEDLIKDTQLLDRSRIKEGLFRLLIDSWRTQNLEDKLAGAPVRLLGSEGFKISEIAYIMQMPDQSVLKQISDYTAKDHYKSSILIVEPDNVVARDLMEQLTSWGYHVAGVASSEHDGYIMATAAHPTIIISEIVFPDGGSGTSLIRRLQESFQFTSVFLTAYPERLLTGWRPEPTFLITKPFSPETLRTIMAQALYNASS